MATSEQIRAAQNAAPQFRQDIFDHEQWGRIIDAASGMQQRGFLVLDARLDMLYNALAAGDLDQARFEFDRVRSASSRLSGLRGRACDPDANPPVSPAPEFSRPDTAPPTVANHDGSRILHRYLGQFVIYSDNLKHARQRVAASALYLDAAALLADLPSTSPAEDARLPGSPRPGRRDPGRDRSR